MLPGPKLYNLVYQVKRYRLIEEELQRALAAPIACDGLLKLVNPRWGGIQPDMLFVRSNIDQILPIQREGWYAIADGFSEARYCLMNHLPDLLKKRLHLWWESGNIGVDRGGC